MTPVSFLVPVVLAAPPPDVVDKVRAAWDATQAYCGSFVFAVHGQEHMAVNTGKSCVDRGGRILTETDGPLGPVIDIRLPGEAWYYDPSRPVVVHLIAKSDETYPDEVAGQGIGEWVTLLEGAESFDTLQDKTIEERPYWLVEVAMGEGDQSAVLFIDQALLLPTALELRKNDAALLSSGYTGLSINPELPDAYFRIRPLFNIPTVELAWDLTLSPSQAAEEAY